MMSLATDFWRAIARPRSAWDSLNRWRHLARAAQISYADVVRYRSELLDNAWFQAHIARALPNVTYIFPEAVEVYAIVRATRPLVVLETGVASGLSSAHILQALAMNRTGELHSIDLPNVQLGSMLPEGRETGWLVPRELRNRWTMHLGEARVLFPDVLHSLPRVDLFLHDSDHSYDHMMFEFEHAYPRLSERAVLLSDDTHLHTAWDDFCARHGLQPSRVGHLGVTRMG